MTEGYDLVVIGSGPGGYSAAIRAAQLGARVAVVEKGQLGGTCTNKGCIPTKALIAGIGILSAIEKAQDFGIRVGKPEIDFPALQHQKSEIVARMRRGIELLFKSHNIDVIKGQGRLIRRDRIEVVGENQCSVVSASRVIIATGSVPSLIPGIDPDGQRVITSDEALELSEIPPSLLIVGGGIIGLEFASIFSALGSKVTIVEMLPRIIPDEDEEISNLLRRSLTKKGIEIKSGTKVAKISRKVDGLEVEVINAEGKSRTSFSSVASGSCVFSVVLIAAGRRPYTEGIGLEETGIEVDPVRYSSRKVTYVRTPSVSNGVEDRRIKVDEKMETSVPGIYAIGDVVGGALLAHVASAEGIVAAENAMGRGSRIDYKVIPNCIYTIPEVASVGLTEEAAEQKGYEIATGKFPFSANGRALALDEREGLVKVVADKSTEEILGMHIFGPQATELIGEASMALKLESTVEEFDRISHPHPTLSEAIFGAVHDVHKEAIDLPKYRDVDRYHQD